METVTALGALDAEPDDDIEMKGKATCAVKIINNGVWCGVWWCVCMWKVKWCFIMILQHCFPVSCMTSVLMAWVRYVVVGYLFG